MPENRNSQNIERKVTPAERFFTRSPYSIVTIVARIKGNVTEAMLRNAVAKVQQYRYQRGIKWELRSVSWI